MEIIPFIKLKKQKITDDSISLDRIAKEINEGEKIYILDLDGIEENKPNLCLYQELSPSCDLWIDSGPRTLGDVVDVFMEGAVSATIRRNLCPTLNISDIREISENKIYAKIDFEKQNSFIGDDLFLNDSDGLVNFDSKEKIEQNFRYDEYFSRMKNKIYSYEADAKNRFFWEQLGIQGLLVDIRKIKEFRYGL